MHLENCSHVADDAIKTGLQKIDLKGRLQEIKKRKIKKILLEKT